MTLISVSVLLNNVNKDSGNMIVIIIDLFHHYHYSINIPMPEIAKSFTNIVG